jgi:hypothetical protein
LDQRGIKEEELIKVVPGLDQEMVEVRVEIQIFNKEV